MENGVVLLRAVEDCATFVSLFTEGQAQLALASDATAETALAPYFAERTLLLAEVSALIGLDLRPYAWADEGQDREDRARDVAELQQRQALMQRLIDHWDDEELRSARLSTLGLQWSRRSRDLTKAVRTLRAEVTAQAAMSTTHRPLASRQPESQPVSGLGGVDFLIIPLDDLDIELTSPLGRGGCGEVFRGKWRSRHQEVAVKRLFARDLQSEEEQRTFQREFRKELAVLHHLRGTPGVVTMLGACIEPRRECIVME